MSEDFDNSPTPRQLDFYKLLGLPPKSGLTFDNIAVLIDKRIAEIEQKGVTVICPHCKKGVLLYHTKIDACPRCEKPAFFYDNKLLTEKQAKKINNSLLREWLHKVVVFSEKELRQEYTKDIKANFSDTIKEEYEFAREERSLGSEFAVVGFLLEFTDSECPEKKRLENLIFPAIMKTTEILKLLPPFPKCPIDCYNCSLECIRLYEFDSRKMQIYQPSPSSLKANPPKYIANVLNNSALKKLRSSVSCKKSRPSAPRKKDASPVNPLKCPICHTALKRQFWKTQYTCTMCDSLLQLNFFGRLVPVKLRLEPCPKCHTKIEITRNSFLYVCPNCGEILGCFWKNLRTMTRKQQHLDKTTPELPQAYSLSKYISKILSSVQYVTKFSWQFLKNRYNRNNQRKK